MAVLAATLAYVTAASVGYSGALVPQRNSLIGTMLGLSASFLVFQTNVSYAGLSFIGKNSYVIFLFHPFFTASTRMFMQALHMKNFSALVLVLTMVGLTAPILVGRIIKLFPLARFAVLGDKWPRRGYRYRPSTP